MVVALNPTRTDDPLETGSPLPLVLRQVLEEADTLALVMGPRLAEVAELALNVPE